MSSCFNMAEDIGYNAEVEKLSWYHHNISRHVAEGLLMANGKDGSYLLRASATHVGEYSLSVRCANSVKHFQIGWDGKHYTFGMGKFANLNDFVDHFENKPLIGGESGVLTLLKYPYPKDVDEPATYDTVRVHAEWGKNRSSLDQLGADQSELSFGSKEGYLTKLGQTVKNWKTRWFVLMRNELSYYKSKGDKGAIKMLNLEDCLEIAKDDTKGKANCFRIVMPNRTYYCFASSAQEEQEWLQILQWKMKHLHGRGRTMSEI